MSRRPHRGVWGTTAIIEILAKQGWTIDLACHLRVMPAVLDLVHLAMEYTRRRADDSVYSRLDSLWMTTLSAGHGSVQSCSRCMPSDRVQTMTDEVS